MLHLKADFIGADEQARTFTFRASTASVDRQGEVIDQAGWQLDAYRRNPVILDSHRYGSIDDILGKAVRVEPMPEGLEVDVEFTDTEKGRMARRMVEDGFLRTVSVGFRSLGRKPGMRAGEPMTHTAMELLEVSMVAIPANRDAVRLRGVEDEVTDEIKAGRRLSKSSVETIAAAIALLQGLLAEEVGDQPMVTDAMKPDEDTHKPGQEPAHKPRKFTIPDDVAAALAAFAKEATNHG